ncbi:11959_t:CDS:1, partial [Racocetra persica]
VIKAPSPLLMTKHLKEDTISFAKEKVNSLKKLSISVFEYIIK